MTRPELVIFDCDGVLVDSEPITNALLREDLAARGLSLTQRDIEDSFVGGTMGGVGKEAARRGADIPDNWLDLIYAEMHRRLALGTPLIDGVEAATIGAGTAELLLGAARIEAGHRYTIVVEGEDGPMTAHVVAKARPQVGGPPGPR